MARVAWIILVYVLQLHILLQLCVEAALASMPSLLPDLQRPARSLPRLLKLDISPSSPPVTPSEPPPPPPPSGSAPPPPTPGARSWSPSPPPPPCPPNYFCPNITSPPPPFRSTSYDTPGKSTYSYTAIVALPVLAVVMIFICSFMLGHNQRAIRGADRGRSGGNSGGAGSAGALVQPIGATAATAGAAGRQGTGKGLDRGLVSKLPTLLFTAEKSEKGAAREEYAYACAVCISDFEEGDTMRLLPACGHTFHKDCIDMWLFSHSTCPLCRLGLFSSNGDLILQEPHRASEWQRGAHQPVDPGPSASAPLDRHVFSPLVNIFRRSRSLIDLSHADMACTRGLAALQRSSSQPVRNSKVYPKNTHSFV